MTPDEDDRRAARFYAVKHELAVVATQARIAGRAQMAMTDRWRRTNYGLAIPAAVLAAVAGAALVADMAGPLPAGAAALAASLCSSLLAVLNPADRVATAMDSARNYLNLDNEADYVTNVELYGEDDIEKAAASLARLRAAKDDVNLRADLPSRRVWDAAVRAEDGLGRYGDIREFLDDQSYSQAVSRETARPGSRSGGRR